MRKCDKCENYKEKVEELGACPFCGGDNARVHKEYPPGTVFWQGQVPSQTAHWLVKCGVCSARTGDHFTQAAARDTWNRAG